MSAIEVYCSVGSVLISVHEDGKYGLKLKFHLARLDSTRHIRRVEPMHFGCVELVEQHISTRSTRRARLARHVELDRRYLQLSYDHCNSFV